MAKTISLSVLLFVLALGLSHPAKASMDQALIAIGQGNMGEAASLLEPLVNQGDPAAMTLMGDLLSSGRGITQDQARAASLYERAAVMGYGPAQIRFGSYLTGQPDGLDSGKAWLQKAADQQEYLAMRALGIIARDIDDDPVEAARWLARAQAYGDPEAAQLIKDLQARQKARVEAAKARAKAQASQTAQAGGSDQGGENPNAIRKSYVVPDRWVPQLTAPEGITTESEAARLAGEDSPDNNGTPSPDGPLSAATEQWPDWLQALGTAGSPGRLEQQASPDLQEKVLNYAGGMVDMADIATRLADYFGSQDLALFWPMVHPMARICSDKAKASFYASYVRAGFDSQVIADSLRLVPRLVSAIPKLTMDRTGSYFPLYPTHEIHVTAKTKRPGTTIDLYLQAAQMKDGGWFLTPPCPAERGVAWLLNSLNDAPLPTAISKTAQSLRANLGSVYEDRAIGYLRNGEKYAAMQAINISSSKITPRLAWEILNLIEMEGHYRQPGAIPLAK